MHLVQILLPTYDNEGMAIPREIFHAIGNELVARFGGLTAHTRAPAEGLWVAPGHEAKRDDIAVFEVMTPILEELWWSQYRKGLEKRLYQESIVIRSYPVQLL
jgi:hypothetical protein